MLDASFLHAAVDWIESHERTVDLLKWATLLLVAWAAGLFQYLRAKTRRPRATLEGLTSRCLIETFDEFHGHKNVVRATFLIEAGVLNPTTEKVVVRDFSLAVRRRRVWRRWKPELIPISLPSRPRFPTGSGSKVTHNWFSNFDDDFRDQTLSSNIEAKEHNSGILLFLSFSHGSWNPLILGQHVRVRLRVRLTTGEVCTAVGAVQILTSPEKFEQWVPGIIDQIGHESAWGATRT